MPQPPPEVTPELLKADLTEDLLQTYLGGPDIAVDTETMGLTLLRDRLCVVQLCNRNGRASLIQIPRSALDSSRKPSSRAPRLKRLLEEPRITKVFHFARFDVAILKHYLGIEVNPIYCTRTVSKLIRTYTERHGLKENLLQFLDVEMDKTARHTDWSAPRLTQEQIRYAISDVTLLLPLMDKLDQVLEREGRKELARDCFRVIPLMAQLDLLGYVHLFEH